MYTGASGPKPGLPNYGFRPFPDLLAEADIVVATCELNEHTRKLFNAAAFAQMKPQSIFVNTCRGGVVDQDALVAVCDVAMQWLFFFFNWILVGLGTAIWPPMGCRVGCDYARAPASGPRTAQVAKLHRPSPPRLSDAANA